mmetsp:Transcript_62635/g.109470  ORF Transcript_62635/g.109470 Transcript_62635/m.109470 type:complete len:155 (+) Transcript_62635:80-544(+)
MGWVPDHIWYQQKAKGKGKGKGSWGKGGGSWAGSSKGGGSKGPIKKPKSGPQEQVGPTQQPEQIMKKITADKKLWIGGLPSGWDVSQKKIMSLKLKKHLSQFGIKCVTAEAYKQGCGAAAFNSTADVEKAVSKLNGSVFMDCFIEFDIWKNSKM